MSFALFRIIVLVNFAFLLSSSLLAERIISMQEGRLPEMPAHQSEDFIEGDFLLNQSPKYSWGSSISIGPPVSFDVTLFPRMSGFFRPRWQLSFNEQEIDYRRDQRLQARMPFYFVWENRSPFHPFFSPGFGYEKRKYWQGRTLMFEEGGPFAMIQWGMNLVLSSRFSFTIGHLMQQTSKSVRRSEAYYRFIVSI